MSDNKQYTDPPVDVTERYIVFLLIFIFGALSTIGLSLFLNSRQEKINEVRFQNAALSFHSLVTDRLEHQLSHAQALQALMQAVPGISKKEFTGFVKHLLSDYTEISDMAWVPVVSPGSMPTFLTMMDRQLGRSFVRKLQMLTDMPGHGDVDKRYFPLTYLAPESQRMEYQGTDLTSLPAMDKAFQAVESCACLRLFPDHMTRGENQTGVEQMLITPVYSEQSPLHDYESRHLKGFVLVYFSFPRMLENTEFSSNLGNITFSVSDLSGDKKRLLYSSVPDVESDASSMSANNRALSYSITAPFAGAPLRYDFVAPGNLTAPEDAWSNILVGAGGAGITLLMLMYVYRTRRFNMKQRETMSHLRENEEKMHALFRNFPMPTYTWRKKGEEFYLVDYNDAASEFTRGRVEEYRGITLGEMYANMPRVVESMNSCYANRRLVVDEMHYPYAHLGVRDLVINYVFVPPDIVMVHTEDVTDRKRAEELVHINESRLLAAQDLARLGYFYCDLGGKESSWSNSLYDILGLERGQEPASIDTLLARVVPEHAEYVRHHISSLNENQVRGGVSVDFRIARPDGTVRSLLGRIVARKAAQGGTVVFGVVQDVTEAKQTEAALRQAKEEAEQAQQAKTEFFSRMTHELRTPLNAIIGFAQLLELDLKNEDERNSVAEILSAGSLLMGILNEILDLSEMETGKLKLRMQAVEISGIARKCTDNFRQLAEQRGIALETRIEQGVEYVVNANETRLEQVINNLISNAIKYNRENGDVVVRLETQGSSKVRLQVEDSGIGLTAEQQQKLVQPFERLGAEYSGIEGTGLGLVVSRKLTELMGGDLGFTSQAGKGSCFWVEFNVLSRGHVSDEGLASAASGQSAGAGSILYIEDNPANLRFVSQVIQEMTDYILYSANTVTNGLELARTLRPNLVLMDINLPDHDGYFCLEKLKEMHETRDIPVIAITAYAMSEDILKGLKAGFDEYLTKPVGVRNLIEVLQHYMTETVN